MVKYTRNYVKRKNTTVTTLVDARINPMFEEEARKRQGTRTDLSANLRGGEGHKAADDAAKMVGGSLCGKWELTLPFDPKSGNWARPSQQFPG